MRKYLVTLAASLTAVAAATAIVAACSGDNGEKGRPGVVSKAQTGSHVNPAIRTGFVVGLDDAVQGHSTVGASEYFEAECFGSGDQLSVKIKAAGGWTVWLQHGSQTIIAENSELGLPRAEFTTAEGTIRKSNSQILWIGSRQATSDTGVSGEGSGVMSTGRSRSLPLWNTAP
ncbi:hypothetical protein IU436_27315, partial [Nocardia farcinica]|nr:hypothetical protein [Nocardia farcinica]MBF6434051.1 hypothetical protein [Nocardia farcinica]MBF6505107.1 hypothetical protein [Nocardia farcinica]